MDNLLKNDLSLHYGLPISTLNICQVTTELYFEIDDIARNITLTTALNSGTAKYSNPNGWKISIIDYDGFLTSLPQNFQNGKKRCDLIVHTDDDSYFILNEIKDRNPLNPDVLTKAVAQMVSTLSVITPVPNIIAFINNFTNKKCCYSNRQSNAPAILSATIAFNRLNSVVPVDGIKLSNSLIESFGFELYEYLGNQTIRLI